MQKILYRLIGPSYDILSDLLELYLTPENIITNIDMTLIIWAAQRKSFNEYVTYTSNSEFRKVILYSMFSNQ